MRKEGMLQPRNQERRSGRLLDGSGENQLQGAVVSDVDPDGDFIQVKLWSSGLGWSMLFKDEQHNTIADVGPYWTESECWAAAKTQLENKGYTI
jgi:hypothetical protein